MKAISFLLFYFTSFALLGQDWTDYLTAKNQHEAFIEKIRKGTDWDSILNTTDTSLVNKYSPAIRETSLYLKSPMLNEVDSFFHAICSEWYSEFPYRVSGHLQHLLNNLAETDTSELNRVLERNFGKSLYPKINHLINQPESETIPLLIEYLENHAATRLVIPSWDWDKPSFYMCVSDMAMELIEIITWCDFLDNAAIYTRLFSNFPSKDKDTTIATIRKWYKATLDLPKNEAAAWFLDSICPYGYSFTYTCENLLYHGDTLTARRTYQSYYEKMNFPCRIDFETGKALIALGDNRVLEDCANKIMNYRCTDESGRKCVYLLLDSNYAYVDNILGEVVATEPHSIYRQKRSGSAYVWPTILSVLGNYEKRKMPVTLLALMQIDDDLMTLGDLSSTPWKKKYGNRIQEGFRVCDLALLKYDDTIKPVNVQNWSDKSERDNAIKMLLKEVAEKKY